MGVKPEEGMKFDTDKPRWSLLPPRTLNEVIAVLEYGAKKYQADNWKYVDNAYQRYYDAAMRHVDAWWNGQQLDPETNKHHLAHAICCMMFLMYIDNN